MASTSTGFWQPKVSQVKYRGKSNRTEKPWKDRFLAERYLADLAAMERAQAEY